MLKHRKCYENAVKNTDLENWRPCYVEVSWKLHSRRRARLQQFDAPDIPMLASYSQSVELPK